jgi:PST family polysaccharide transporter
LTEKSSSYHQILRSSMVIGGSSALGLVMGLVRNKAVALMLGPTGFGLMGLYTAISDVTRSAAGMGVNQSGVRQIAESAAKGGMERAAVTAYVLRRTSIVLGILGAIVLFLFAEQVSTLSFGDGQRANAVRLLSGVVLLRLISDGQGALLQGLRRIGDLAKVNILGNLYGTVALVAIVYVAGEKGIVPSLLVAAVLGTATAAWYVRRLGIHPSKTPMRAVSVEAAELLRLGMAFMVSAFATMGAAYAVRAIVSGAGGLHAAGLYQAAWALSGMYTGFILQAMGTDFYPRLVAGIGDTELRNRLTNEQMAASMVLAGPGIIATLALAPFALSLLYSGEFHDAAPTLRWICLGMALRVVTWPPGFLIVSMNERWFFMGTEIAWAVMNVGLTWLLVSLMGLEGAGVAFAASYLSHGVVVYTIVRKRYGFKLERSAVSAATIFISSIALVLLGFYFLREPIATAFAVLVALVVSLLSLRALVTMIPRERIPSSVARCLRLFGLQGAGP